MKKLKLDDALEEGEESTMIWNSESLFKGENDKLDQCITDLTIISGLYFKDSFERFVTAGNEENGKDNIRVYRYEEGSIIHEKSVTHENFAYSTLFVPTMKAVASFDHIGCIQYFDINNGFELKSIFKFDIKAPIWRGILLTEYLICVIQNPNGRGGFLSICDWRDGKHSYLKTSHKDEVWCVRLLKNNNRLIVSGGGSGRGSDTAVRIWDWKKETLVKEFDRIHEDRIVYLKSFIESKSYEERIVTSSRDGVLVMWNLEGEALRVLSCCEKEYNTTSKKKMRSHHHTHKKRKSGEHGSLFTADLKNRVLKKIKDKEHQAKIDQIYWADHRKRSIISVGRDGDIRKIVLLENQRFNDDEDERIEFLIENFLEKRIEFFSHFGYHKVWIKILPYYLLF